MCSVNFCSASSRNNSQDKLPVNREGGEESGEGQRGRPRPHWCPDELSAKRGELRVRMEGKRKKKKYTRCKILIYKTLKFGATSR